MAHFSGHCKIAIVLVTWCTNWILRQPLTWVVLVSEIIYTVLNQHCHLVFALDPYILFGFWVVLCMFCCCSLCVLNLLMLLMFLDCLPFLIDTRVTFVCLRPVSCVSNVACVSVLPILDRPFAFL